MKTIQLKHPVTALVLALAGVVVCPSLLVIELSAMILSAMVISEPANSLLVKVLSVVVVILVGLLVSAIATFTFISSRTSRATAQSMSSTAIGLASAAVVISSVVAAVVVLAQLYLLLVAGGLCSLEGCPG